MKLSEIKMLMPTLLSSYCWSCLFLSQAYCSRQSDYHQN